MRQFYIYIILTVSLLLHGCKDLPIDSYSISFKQKEVTILTDAKLKEIKQEFHRVCKENNMRQSDEREPPSDSYIGIWYIYIRSIKAGDRENFASVIFYRNASIIDISVRTDGSVAESDSNRRFKADLLSSLNKVVGPENVNYRREFSSGIN